MKILIVTPSFKILGGVSNHYMGLHDFWTFDVRYSVYGKRKRIPAIIMLPIDWFKFLFTLLFRRPNLVVINPSLRNYQLLRDGVYLLTARLFRIKVVCFFHGWDDNLAVSLQKRKGLFKLVYNRSTLILVLAKSFKEVLINAGIEVPIELTSTKVNDHLLSDFSIEMRDGSIKEILFLGRIVRNKGIFIALDAFKIILKNYPDIKLRVVGSGEDLELALQKVKNDSIRNVTFTGPVFQHDIVPHFKETQLYILPTTHGEGMPTSVLEAMAFGMPVITTPLGGLNDFFLDGEMGKLLGIIDSEIYASQIISYIEDPVQVAEISVANYHYAHEHFLASKVSRRLENLFESYVN